MTDKADLYLLKTLKENHVDRIVHDYHFDGDIEAVCKNSVRSLSKEGRKIDLQIKENTLTNLINNLVGCNIFVRGTKPLEVTPAQLKIKSTLFVNKLECIIKIITYYTKQYREKILITSSTTGMEEYIKLRKYIEKKSKRNYTCCDCSDGELDRLVFNLLNKIGYWRMKEGLIPLECTEKLKERPFVKAIITKSYNQENLIIIKFAALIEKREVLAVDFENLLSEIERYRWIAGAGL